MTRDDLDAFLAECDDVIDDWEGSYDAASWSADGSHEHDTGGEYYGNDHFVRHDRLVLDAIEWAELGGSFRLALDAIHAFAASVARTAVAMELHRPFIESERWDRCRDGYSADYFIVDETASWDRSHDHLGGLIRHLPTALPDAAEGWALDTRLAAELAPHGCWPQDALPPLRPVRLTADAGRGTALRDSRAGVDAQLSQFGPRRANPRPR